MNCRGKVDINHIAHPATEDTAINKRHELLLHHILRDVKADLNDDDIVEILLDRSALEEASSKKDTLGQRAADGIARFAGSWLFIGLFGAVLAAWMTLNTLFMRNEGFDPYPYILLNLMLSCLAAIQAPLIMMAQNRQEEKDRARNQSDHRVNLKTEVIISDMHEKLARIEKLLEHIQNASP